MIAALALLLQATSAPGLPADWSALPAVRWRVPPQYNAEMARFVVEEARAGRCNAAQRDEAGYRLQVNVAVLVSADGEPKTIVPRAIGCPTVEQYVSGLVSRLARDNLDATPGDPDSWYRASITFSWTP